MKIVTVMADLKTIDKSPQLKPDQDYQGLRDAGLQYIEELGSSIWTIMVRRKIGMASTLPYSANGDGVLFWSFEMA